jgi:hypothetical protein
MTSASICYLCGLPVPVGTGSKDHAVPKQLLEDHPPRTPGFQYGGHIPTHEKCNNEFGPETYGQRALELVHALHDPRCHLVTTLKDDPSISVMALNSACLPNFRTRELRFFKMMNRLSFLDSPLPRASEFANAEAVDPIKQSVDVALAVLLKSAAALVIKRHLTEVPSTWQVLAIPFVGDPTGTDFGDLLGDVKPFGPQVQVWSAVIETDDVLVVYRASNVVVFFFFRFSPLLIGWRRMLDRFKKFPRLRFDGKNINEVLTVGWQRFPNA